MKPRPNPLLLVRLGELRRQHLLERLRLQERPVAALAAGEQARSGTAPGRATVEYMLPAGAMPSSNVGAGNSRPW